MRSMDIPTRRERIAAARELKEFAFEESPQFRLNQAQGMEIKRGFTVYDDWGERYGVRPSGQLDREELNIEIGLRAARISLGDGWKPEYSFSAWWVASRLIHPEQLELEAHDWTHLYHQYNWEDEDEYDDGDEDEDEEPSTAKTDIINTLIAEGVVCEQYNRADYQFETSEGDIQFSDERGFVVGGDTIGAVETHPFDTHHYLIENNQPVGVEQIKDPFDKLLSGSLFDKVTHELREQYQQCGNIMPHEEKLREMRFLVSCLRNRMIKL